MKQIRPLATTAWLHTLHAYNQLRAGLDKCHAVPGVPEDLRSGANNSPGIVPSAQLVMLLASIVSRIVIGDQSVPTPTMPA